MIDIEDHAAGSEGLSSPEESISDDMSSNSEGSVMEQGVVANMVDSADIGGRKRMSFMTKRMRTMKRMKNRMLMKFTQQKMRKKKRKKIAKLVRRQMKTRNRCPLILMALTKKVMQVCRPINI